MADIKQDLLSLQYSTSFSLSGMEETNIDLQLSVAPPPPSTLTGIIRNSSGQAVAGSFVGLYQVTTVQGVTTETLVATTKTNSEGKYLFGGVLAGDYLVKAKLEQ